MFFFLCLRSSRFSHSHYILNLITLNLLIIHCRSSSLSNTPFFYLLLFFFRALSSNILSSALLFISLLFHLLSFSRYQNFLTLYYHCFTLLTFYFFHLPLQIHTYPSLSSSFYSLLTLSLLYLPSFSHYQYFLILHYHKPFAFFLNLLFILSLLFYPLKLPYPLLLSFYSLSTVSFFIFHFKYNLILHHHHRFTLLTFSFFTSPPPLTSNTSPSSTIIIF